jgi:hypothetical protein
MLLAETMVLLEKLETSYATDSTPDATNALLGTNVNMVPFAGSTADRKKARALFGNDPLEHVGTYQTLTYDVGLAGAGAAGTAPLYGPSIRTCDLLETITGGVKVDYTTQNFNPATSKSSTIKFNWGGFQWALLGSRGTLSLVLEANQLPQLRISKTGLFTSAADVALLDVESQINSFLGELEVNKANTTFTFFGVTPTLQSLQIDLGNVYKFRDRPNAAIVSITDRLPAFSATFELDSVATKDWMGIARAGTLDAMAVVHGATAGNIINFDAAKCQLVQPSVENIDGILHLKTGGKIIRQSGATPEWRLRAK